VDIFHPVKTTGPPYELGLGENLWPATPGDFRAIAEKYIADLVFLATEVLRALALALGVDEKIFISRIKEPFWNLRVLRVPSSSRREYRRHRRAHRSAFPNPFYSYVRTKVRQTLAS
jgi:isopenicillin N synthase-like dioxygenase